MAIITLTTDMGLRDHYVAVVKGAILSQCPDATIVDITHHITPFNNAQAAFVLQHAYPEFPRGSIHIIGVNPDTDGGKTPHMVVRHNGHFFIGSDNGIFSLLFEGMPHEAYELTMMLEDDYQSFPTKSVFVKAACHLARGGTADVIGRKVAGVRELFGFQPAVDSNTIRGKVVHIDSYGNLITNVQKKLFSETSKGRTFVIHCGRSKHDIKRIHKNYGDVPNGDLVAFFGANELLQIAINKGAEGAGGGASSLLGMHNGDTVRVEFGDWART